MLCCVVNSCVFVLLLIALSLSVMGGSNNKKDHAAGKKPRCPLSFLFFFVLFQNTFKIDVFVPNSVKNVSSKKNKKDHDFLSFLIFFVLFCCFCRIFLRKCPQTENK